MLTISPVSNGCLLLGSYCTAHCSRKRAGWRGSTICELRVNVPGIISICHEGWDGCSVQQNRRAHARVRSILRIMVALLFLEHGMSRLFGWPSPLPYPPIFTLYWFAGFFELVGGALLLIGLFTRPVAFILSGEMAFAYFLSHAPKGFYPISSGNGGELAIVYCFVFLY